MTTMPGHFFDFQENPFSLSPDPRFFYANRMYREAYDQLYEVINEHRGFMALTGETGAGKTTLLKTLMRDLDTTHRCVYLEYSNLNFDDLLEHLCNKLGLKTAPARCGEILGGFLLEQSQQGATLACIIDEAQNMPSTTLAQIEGYTRALSHRQNLLQVILSGQPQLTEMLERPELHSLRNRLHTHYRLSPLAVEEVPGFINHRLSVAGNSSGNPLTREAMQRVARFAQGKLRLINMLCSRALMNAYAMSQKRVSVRTIEVAIWDLQTEAVDPVDLQQQTDRRIQADKASPASPSTNAAPMVVMPWPENLTQRENRFRPLLSKAAQVGKRALHLVLTRLHEWSRRRPPTLAWARALGIEIRHRLSSLTRDSRIHLLLWRKQLSLWFFGQSIGPGRTALVAALTWTLLQPVLEQRAERPQAALNIPSSNLSGPVQKIEIASLVANDGQTRGGATLDSPRQASSVLPGDQTRQTQALPDGAFTDQPTRDSTAKLAALAQALQTARERLAKTETELARSHEKLKQAHIRIEEQNVHILTHLVQTDALIHDNDALKQRMISPADHPTPAQPMDGPNPMPLAHSAVQDRSSENRPPAREPDPAARIVSLLQRAAQLLAARHLTSPAGNNAFELYSRVLKIDPNNRSARNGVDQIKQQYMTWATQAKQQSDWLNASNYYRKALIVDPSNPLATAGLREASEREIKDKEKNAS